MTLGLASVCRVPRILHAAQEGNHTFAGPKPQAHKRDGNLMKKAQVHIVSEGEFRRYGFGTDPQGITP